jgi:hypothetical protein
MDAFSYALDNTVGCFTSACSSALRIILIPVTQRMPVADNIAGATSKRRPRIRKLPMDP